MGTKELDKLTPEKQEEKVINAFLEDFSKVIYGNNLIGKIEYVKSSDQEVIKLPKFCLENLNKKEIKETLSLIDDTIDTKDKADLLKGALEIYFNKKGINGVSITIEEHSKDFLIALNYSPAYRSENLISSLIKEDFDNTKSGLTDLEKML
jgi:hypothetical protein